MLNKARENIPTDRQIWISAAKLEEAHENFHMVPKIIERGMATILCTGLHLGRGAGRGIRPPPLEIYSVALAYRVCLPPVCRNNHLPPLEKKS